MSDREKLFNAITERSARAMGVDMQYRRKTIMQRKNELAITRQLMNSPIDWEEETIRGERLER